MASPFHCKYDTWMAPAKRGLEELTGIIQTSNYLSVCLTVKRALGELTGIHISRTIYIFVSETYVHLMGRIACALIAAASAPATASKAESGRSVVAAPAGTAPTTLKMATSFNCRNK